MPGQGSDRGLAEPLGFGQCLVSPTVVGQGALPRFRHLVVALAATKAPEGLGLLGFGFAGGFLSRAVLDIGDVLCGADLAWWWWWCGIGVEARRAVRSAGAAVEMSS